MKIQRTIIHRENHHQFGVRIIEDSPVQVMTSCYVVEEEERR